MKENIFIFILATIVHKVSYAQTNLVPTSSQTIPPNSVKVQFQSDTPGLGLYIVKGRTVGESAPPLLYPYTYTGPYYTSMTHYDLLCLAPCEINLLPGNYPFGVGLKSDKVIETGVTTITSPGILYGKYKNNKGIRIAGWVIFGSGFLIGTTITTGGLLLEEKDNLALSLVISGCSIMLLSTLIGVIMAAIPDSAELEFHPVAQ